MDELDGFSAAVRGLLASLPADTAVALLSLLALATLLRASRRVPLNSAFARRTDGKERLEIEAESESDPRAREDLTPVRRLRRV